MKLARGHFEQMQREGDALRVRGWMFVPESPLSEFRALAGGQPVGTCTPRSRDDVRRAYPKIPHAALSGFDFALSDPPRAGSRIEVQGWKDGVAVAELCSLVRTDLDEVVPAPPGDLLARTLGTPSPEYYRAEGLRAFSEFKDAIERHRPLASVGRMLDWGCGPGRNAVHFLIDGSVGAVVGCDLDEEAIGWCRAHLGLAQFEITKPDPPTSFADASFDLVIGCSVFTHLSEAAQEAWLAELRRILVPGGLLVTSVHGDFAASLHFGALGPAHRLAALVRWKARGFLDLGEDPRLEGTAPPGYYRAVFQSERYTRRRWSRLFDVLDYLPAGMQAHQDLVVMRRPAAR